MLIDAQSIDETRVVVMDGERIDVVDFENDAQKQLKSNVYLARITRVEPSLQAAFVDYGGNRHGFLPFSEIHPDYYQIPAADRERLIAEAAEKLAERQAERLAARKLARERARKVEAASTTELGAREFDPDNGGKLLQPDSSYAESVMTGDDVVSQNPDENFSSSIEIIEETQEPLFNELIPSLEQTPDSNAAGPDADLDESSGDHPPSNSDHASPLPTDDSFDEQTDVEKTNQALTYSNDATSHAEIIDLTTDVASAETDSSASNNLVTDGDKFDDDDHLDEDEELEARAILRSIIAGRYKIQDVIKRRQVVLIQVSKEERGNKGAALTSYLSLAGRYCVLMPNTHRGGGISRKIANPRDRRKLKQILEDLQIPRGVSVIVRTAGSERSKAEIRRDYDYLMRTWGEIREKTLTGQPPCLVYEEGNVIKRAVRDLYSRDMDEIVVDGQNGFDAAKNFMRVLTPSHAKKVKLHQAVTPLFLDAGIEAKIDLLHDPVVPLNSGGYLVMNQTEALVAVDVNSGKATREQNIEDTALQTNLEAATEVARQLRLRDMAGLVVIDFIDMDESRHRAQVERKLRDAMKGDRARIQLGRISSFGLLELSRQRLRPSVFETSMQTCSACSGTGLVRTDISFGRAILRRAEQLAQTHSGSIDGIEITVPFNAGLLILNQLRQELVVIEGRLGCGITVFPDAHKNAPQFHVALQINGRVQNFEEGANKREQQTAKNEGRRSRGNRRGERRNGRAERTVSHEPTAAELEHNEVVQQDIAQDEVEEANQKRPRKRARGNRRKSTIASELDSTETNTDADDQAAALPSESEENEESTDDHKKRSRRRGKRGGRRRSKKDDEQIVATNEETAEAGDTNGDGDSENGSRSKRSETSGESLQADDQASAATARKSKRKSVSKTKADPDVTADTDKEVDQNRPSQNHEPNGALEDTPPKDGPKRRGWFNRAKDLVSGK